MTSLIRITFLAASLLAMFNVHASPEATADSQPAPRRVLPLDHGPRAQSTPWVNAQMRQREARAAAAVRPSAPAEAHADAAPAEHSGAVN